MSARCECGQPLPEHLAAVIAHVCSCTRRYVVNDGRLLLAGAGPNHFCDLHGALLALEKAGGGLTVTPKTLTTFVPTPDGKYSWTKATTKRRADDTYVTLIVRGVEKALGKGGVSDRHEWEVGEECFFASAATGLGRRHPADGGAAMLTESFEDEIECALELARPDWPGSCEEAVTVAHEYSTSAGSEILRLAERVADLEDVIRERGAGTPEPAAVDREAFEAMEPADRFLHYREAAGWALEARRWERAAGEAEDRSRLLGSVAAPLLPLFRDLEADWRRLSEADFPHRDTVTLTAEFPVAELRTLTKEGK